MKSARLSGLGSPRLSVFLMASIIGLSAMGAMIEARQQAFSPEARYLLQVAGLSDVLHSGWFILILMAMVLNLSASAIERFPAVWRVALQRVPPAVKVDQVTGAKKSEKYVYLDLESGIHREEFRELVYKWSRGNVGKPHVLDDEGGLNELQVAAQKGRFNRVLVFGAHFGMVLLLAGFAIGSFFGFEGRVTIDEGGKVDYLEVTRGTPRAWEPWVSGGQTMAGFFKPGFAIECVRFDVDFHPGTDRAKAFRSWLTFSEEGKPSYSRQLAVNRPIRFKGMSFHQVGFADTGRTGAVLTVYDRKTDFELPIPKAQKGGTYKVGGDAEVSILEIREELEDLGAAANL